jgi:hypothetical protein
VAGQTDAFLVLEQEHPAYGPAFGIHDVARFAAKRRMRTHLDLLGRGEHKQEDRQHRQAPAHLQTSASQSRSKIGQSPK